MRRSSIVLAAFLIATACAKPAAPGAGSGPSPSIDAERLGIYEAVIRSQIEFDEERVWIYDRICEGAEGPGSAEGTCPDAFSPDEQQALLQALSDVPHVEFVSGTDALTDRIFNGEVTGQIIRVGPIVERDDDVEVAGSHYCGGLCGGGSVWLVREAGDGWEVTGPAPGHGTWIS
jgi:hypothetical protein